MRTTSMLIVLTLLGCAWISPGTMIFPELDPTPITFLCGFGVPVQDLTYEAVIPGYALRMQYFLPNYASQLSSTYFKPQPITDRRFVEPNLGSMYRWIIYRALEMVIQYLGLPGHGCLLRVICEHASVPLSHESGLLGEVLHVILTPSSSMDKLGTLRDRHYKSAERFGRRGGNCEAAFIHKCPRSPIDLISIMLEFNDI